MSTIWKWSFRVDNEVTVSMPRGCELLAVGKQESPTGEISIWYRVPSGSSGNCTRRILVRGTGHPGIPDAASYIGTVIDGTLVWHVFDGGWIE